MSLNYSDFEPLNTNKKIQRKRATTLKNRKKDNKKVQDMLEAIDNDSDNGEDLHNIYNDPPQQTYKDFNPKTNDGDITKEAFNNLDSNSSDEYYKQFIPYYNELANNQELSGNKDVLLEKLNYMIHLLEEQQEEKTGHITEELILYCFLGVFIIFVVDSFARAGKYVR